MAARLWPVLVACQMCAIRADGETVIRLRGHPEGQLRVPIRRSGGYAAMDPELRHRVGRAALLKAGEGDSVQVLISATEPGGVRRLREDLDPFLEASEYIPDGNIALYTSVGRLEALSEHASVKWIGHMRPLWKSVRNLDEMLTNGNPNTRVHLSITTILNRANALASLWSSEYGENFLSISDREVRVVLGRTKSVVVVSQLREHEGVHWIEQVHPKFTSNYMPARSIQGGNTGPNPTKIWSKGITGAGQLIHVHDTGLDTSHCFFTSSQLLRPCDECKFKDYYRLEPNRTELVQDIIINQLACNHTYWNISGTTIFKRYLMLFTGDKRLESLNATECKEIVCRRYANASKYSCDLEYSRNLDAFDLAWKQMVILNAERHGHNKHEFGCPTSALDDIVSGGIAESEFQCNFVSPTCTTLQPGQRKVKAYWAFADTRASYSAHGTHVCGSAIGQAENALAPINKFKGIAHGASLVFSDGSFEERTRIGREAGAIFTPPNLHDMFDWAYGLGARISSHSWGSAVHEYTSSSAAIDRYAHEHPDFLILFAAGNSGLGGSYTIDSQAQSKNALSIGAATQPIDYEASNVEENPKDLANSTQIVDYYCSGKGIDAKEESVWRRFACGVCERNSSLVREADVALYVLQLLPDYGTQFGFCQACRLDFVNFEGLESGEYHMAFFSSRGPAADGRIKPDVITPGHIVVSSNADDRPETQQCNDQTLIPPTFNDSPGLLTDSGTSMATPIAAGAAALVREWYIEGYHAQGTRSPEHGIHPTAALVKATMIASTVPVRGSVYVPSLAGFCGEHGFGNQSCYLPLTESPEFVYHTGFGFLQLANALYFEGDAHMLYHDDARTGLAQGSQCQYSVEFDAGKAPDLDPIFQVVVVWSDPPGSPASSKALVNDLDLTATLDGGKMILVGNGLLLNATIKNNSTNVLNATSRDSTNNVEKISISTEDVQGDDKKAKVQVNLKARLVAVGYNQSYALVMVMPKDATVSRRCTESGGGGGGNNGDNKQGIGQNEGILVGIVLGSIVGGLLLVGVLVKSILHFRYQTFVRHDGETSVSNGESDLAYGKLQLPPACELETSKPELDGKNPM